MKSSFADFTWNILFRFSGFLGIIAITGVFVGLGQEEYGLDLRMTYLLVIAFAALGMCGKLPKHNRMKRIALTIGIEYGVRVVPGLIFLLIFPGVLEGQVNSLMFLIENMWLVWGVLFLKIAIPIVAILLIWPELRKRKRREKRKEGVHPLGSESS